LFYWVFFNFSQVAADGGFVTSSDYLLKQVSWTALVIRPAICPLKGDKLNAAGEKAVQDLYPVQIETRVGLKDLSQVTAALDKA